MEYSLLERAFPSSRGQSRSKDWPLVSTLPVIARGTPLSLRDIMRMSDEEAHARFASIRFAANNGEPFCPHCGNLKVYPLAETPPRWKCAACCRKFSGTLFHSRKLPIKDYLAIVFQFANGVKGKAALHIARDMNVGPKSIFVLLHKLREAMGAAIGTDELEGEIEIDGAYFGGRTRPENRRADRRQQRRPERQVVVVARERGLGQTVAWIVNRESEAVPMIRQAVASGTEVHADEAGGWDILHASFPMKRVNHSREFKADDGACTNQAEKLLLPAAPFRVQNPSPD
jgi:transposase-like protein